ncbi:helix-turn-helix domain-containing protein [Candidatus Pacearchaeota archaeon]|nr:helix-turn-helix domain-containing protein [Candidatus Pacearchaeota archaeon]
MNKTSLLGSMLNMGKRLITEKQEQALRLCHQDFDGLSPEEAAKRMNISPSAINRLLTKVKEIMPQYFSILTKLEAERYHLYMAKGWSVDEIAEHFGLTPNSIYKALQRARDKGMYFTEAKSRILSYNESMDASIKQQF